MQLASTVSARAIAQEIRGGSAVPASSGRRFGLRKALMIAAAAVFGVLLALHGQEFVDAMRRAIHAGWQPAVVGAALEAASLAGYVLLLHRVVSSASPRLRLKDSYDITLAGTATMRLLPTAGLGGAAVTVWALRARGVRPRELTERMLAFLLLQYAVYMAALLLAGAAIAIGIVHVGQGYELGLVGVLLASGVAAAVLALLAVPSIAAGLLSIAKQSSPRLAGLAGRLEAHLPVLKGALRQAGLELRRPSPALLGAVAYWAFDIAVLAAMLHAFGATLPITAVVLAYFLGTMFNVLPLPGSLSGGLIGVLIALGTPAGGAIAAVLAYRSIAVWLPAATGVASLARLRSSVASWRGEPTSA